MSSISPLRLKFTKPRIGRDAQMPFKMLVDRVDKITRANLAGLTKNGLVVDRGKHQTRRLSTCNLYSFHN
jgi:hypothetical protein